MRSSKPPLQVFVELFWVDSMVDYDIQEFRGSYLSFCG